MSFSYTYLINQDHIDFSKLAVGEQNEILTYFIDSEVEAKYLDRYYASSVGFVNNTNAIQITSIGNFLNNHEFIRDIFIRLDEIIDLDFVEMSHNNGSILDIYPISFASNFQENTVGMCIKQEVQAGKWFDVLWLAQSQSNLNSFDKNTIIHEIGHSIGLSHPNDDGFDERWSSEDTVMSYNKGGNDWNFWFSDEDLNALTKIWGRENDNGTMIFNKNFEKYKFFQSSDKKYSIETSIGKESITGIKSLKFPNKLVDVEEDIEGVFNQITGTTDITGKIFRLYNAAFNRFPDSEGLNYWIRMNLSEENTYRQTCSSFIISNEFISKYGNLISNESYINTLYNNILGRTADDEGMQYWLSNLNQGVETRSEVLMGFSESNENIGIFQEVLGWS